jgi:hypothetical protein
MNRLEKLTHICLIMVSLVSIGIILDIHFRPPTMLITSNPQASLVGKALTFPEVDWRLSNVNVLVLINDQCHYCEKSTPFFQRISQLRAGSNGKVRFFAVSQQTEEKTRNYLNAHQILTDGVVRASHGIAQVTNTPTLILVNSSGVVKNAYIGLLTDEQEKVVFAKITELNHG